MERLTIRTASGAANIVYSGCLFPDGKEDYIAKSARRQLAIDRLAAYEDTDLEPQLVQLLADTICGKTGVFCPKCGDGLCLAAGTDGLQIGCFGCGEYVSVKELFEVYRIMKGEK